MMLLIIPQKIIIAIISYQKPNNYLYPTHKRLPIDISLTTNRNIQIANNHKGKSIQIKNTITLFIFCFILLISMSTTFFIILI